MPLRTTVAKPEYEDTDYAAEAIYGDDEDDTPF